MTLEELIDHEEKESKATWNGKPTLCAEEHRQLAEWLKELKQLRKQVNSSENPNKRNKSEARRWKRRYLDLKQRMFKLEEQTRWIPVSERLPENDEDVLACYPQGEMEVVYYHIDNSIYPTEYEDLNETGWYNEEGDALYFEPIAWMPLPEPYKASPTDEDSTCDDCKKPCVMYEKGMRGCISPTGGESEDKE